MPSGLFLGRIGPMRVAGAQLLKPVRALIRIAIRMIEQEPDIIRDDFRFRIDGVPHLKQETALGGGGYVDGLGELQI